MAAYPYMSLLPSSLEPGLLLRPELEPHPPRRPRFEAPRVREHLNQSEAEATRTLVGARLLGDVHVACRSGLLDLDANVGIIRLDAKVDQLRIRLQAGMAYRVADEFSDGKPRVVGSTVERRRWDGVVQSVAGKARGKLVHRQDHLSA
jgi:hypothetical protein